MRISTRVGTLANGSLSLCSFRGIRTLRSSFHTPLFDKLAEDVGTAPSTQKVLCKVKIFRGCCVMLEYLCYK